MIYALYGFLAAAFAVLLFVLIWHLAKAKLERWGYDLNRETLSRLRELQTNLDSIQSREERILAQLERLTKTVKPS
jgi:hypothetical protein